MSCNMIMDLATNRKYIINQLENEELEAQFLNHFFSVPLAEHCIEPGSEEKFVRLTSILRNPS